MIHTVGNYVRDHDDRGKSLVESGSTECFGELGGGYDGLEGGREGRIGGREGEREKERERKTIHTHTLLTTSQSQIKCLKTYRARLPALSTASKNISDKATMH